MAGARQDSNPDGGGNHPSDSEGHSRSGPGASDLDRLDESIEEDKEPNPFLHGVPAILAALRSGQIECRVYDKDKFHAKAYITHAKLEVVGAQALVGSSNFTRPGLTKNIELNVQIQSAREVAQLQEWFETHWNEASEVTEAVIETISRHTHLYSPFDVYAKALQQFFRGHELTATEWDETRSRMFPHVDRYQKEAYWALMKIARQHGGAFLCDGVGLGKTFVGLMLIERLILHEGKRVALFAPKAAKEGYGSPTCVGGFRTSAASAVARTSATWPSSATPTSDARGTSRSVSSALRNSPTSSSSTRRTTSAIRAAGVTPTGESNRRATTACSSCSTTRNAPRPCSC